MTNKPDQHCSAGNESAADTEMYRLRDLIASHIACEADCQKMPTGCGCALTAARAVMNAVPQSVTYCTPDGPANCEAWAVGKRCPTCPVTRPDRGGQ